MPIRKGTPDEGEGDGEQESDPLPSALLPLLQTRLLEIRILNGVGDWITACLVARVHRGGEGGESRVQHTLVHPN
jgi:hypothetical protein